MVEHPKVHVRAMLREDWPAVERVYAQGIETGLATFEAETPTWEQFDVGKLKEHRFVAELDGLVVGWVALSPFSARKAYAGVAELSVYVSPTCRGSGVGFTLLEQLIVSSEAAGIWTLTSTVLDGNKASLRLHEKSGFRVIGRREKVSRISRGPRSGQWLDSIILERRSRAVGL